MANDLQSYRVKDAPPTVYYIPDFITEEEEKMLLTQVYSAPSFKWTVLSHRRLQNWGGLPGPKGMVSEDLPEWLLSCGKKINAVGAFGGKFPNHVLVNEYKPGQGIMPHEDGSAFYPTVSTINLGSHTLLDFYYHISTGSEVSQQSESHISTDTNIPSVMSAWNQVSGGTNEVGASNQDQRLQRSDACAESCHGSPRITMKDGGECVTEGVREDLSFDSRHFMSLLLQPRSLVMLQDDMYKIHLHGIKEVTHDTITDKVVNLDSVKGVSLGDVLERKTRVSLTIRYVPKVLKSKIIFGKR